MKKDDKKISEFVKENYKVPYSVDQKMNAAFEKIREKNICPREVERKAKKLNMAFKLAAAMAALFLAGNAIALAFGTDNIYSMIYRFFEPDKDEKTEHVFIEGEKQEVDYGGVESSLGYTIQYDRESFDLQRIDDKDYYRLNIPDMTERVYFTVYRTDAAYEDLKDDDTEETTIGGRSAFMTEWIDGKEYDVNASYSWDSEIIDTWYIDAGNGTYVIEIHCFMEAYEGWGSRMRQIIDSFKLVK